MCFLSLLSSGLPPASAMVIFAIDLYHWWELPQIFLSRQNTSCRDRTFVTAKIVCRDKTFVTCLSRQAYFSHDKRRVCFFFLFFFFFFFFSRQTHVWRDKICSTKHIDRLVEKGVERGSARRSSLKGRERAVVSQTNTKTISQRDGVERIRAFPSAYIPSWTVVQFKTSSLRGQTNRFFFFFFFCHAPVQRPLFNLRRDYFCHRFAKSFLLPDSFSLVLD